MCTSACTDMVLLVTLAWIVDGLVCLITGLLAYCYPGRKYRIVAVVTGVIALFLLVQMIHLRSIGGMI